MDCILNEKAFMQWRVPRSIAGGSEREVQSARDPTPDPLPASPAREKSTTPRLPSLRGSVQRAPSGAASRSRGVTPLPVPSSRAGVRCPPPAALKPTVAPRAAALLADANPSERRVIEKALLLAEHSAITDSLRRSLQPEAEAQVRKWLETASPEEREVALNFFHSIAGNKVMTTAGKEKRERLLHVLKALENGDSAVVSQSHPHFTVGDGSSSLRHLRLLTPNTRRNRWIHTTWHHLPPYKDSDPVDNRSSHYSLPHRPVPRHFTIHPDWGK